MSYEQTDEYGKFTDKFKTKLTTDDCYTPAPVYEAIKGWVVSHFGLAGRRIVRPFYPGGDFEKFEYLPGDVVIDNPPFSIFAKILEFFESKEIDVFLFGPQLTLFKQFDFCYVPANCTITYENGAKVNTGFVTSLEKGYRVRNWPDLCDAVKKADKDARPPKTRKRLVYPDCVVSSALLAKLSGTDYGFTKEGCAFTQTVGGEKVFGGAFLLSSRNEAERREAERREAERREAERREAERREAERRELSGKELELLRNLG